LSSLSFAEFAATTTCIEASVTLLLLQIMVSIHARHTIIDPPIDLIPRCNNEDVSQRLLTVHNLITENLKIATKAKQNYYANHSLTPKEFVVKERVLVSTQDLKLVKPT
jgi:hypothetical protein